MSRFFLPLIKENPAEAQIVSHRLMLRAGMIKQQSAGNYTWLPLGLRVLKKIEQIVREEQNRAGSVEILMPTIQSAELWRESGRYEAYGKEMLRITDRHDRDLLFGPTAEEVVHDVFRSYVKTYKSLPLNLYNIQWKFRDEIRPRFGVMRGREFFMKDGYSFDVDEEAARKSYNRMYVAYLRTYARMGLTAIPMKAETGPIGGDLSHEFIVLAETGESAVFCHKDLLDMPVPDANVDFDSDLTDIIHQRSALYAATEDVHDAESFAKVPADKQVSARGIEVGQIFYYGTKYADSMNVKVAGPDGKEVPVHGGCYGVGVSRLVGAIIEACHDDAGIVWPEEVAPFTVGLVNIRAKDESCVKVADNTYNLLTNAGIETLYDDTDESAGKKFASMDLIGLPWQMTIGPRGVEAGTVELKNRKTGEKQELSLENALEVISKRKMAMAA
jgi:prolyl-tRNA synthetase